MPTHTAWDHPYHVRNLLQALEKLVAAIEDATWEENYQALVAYKAKYGHTNVPVDYKSDSPGVCGQIPLAEAEAAIREAREGAFN